MHASVSMPYNSGFLDADAKKSTLGAIQKNIRKDSVANNPIKDGIKSMDYKSIQRCQLQVQECEAMCISV